MNDFGRKYLKLIDPISFCAKALCLALIFVAAGAQAKSIPVATTAELADALKAASPGDTLALGPGNYGELSLDGTRDPHLAFSGKVVIAASQKDSPPVFTRVVLRNVTNLEFSGIAVQYLWHAGDSKELRVFSIEQSKGIAILNATFRGDRIHDTGTDQDESASGSAIGVQKAEDIKVSGNTISTFHRGAIFGEVKNLEVSNNDISDMSSDGLDFAAISNGVITANHIHDLSRSETSKAHPDMIQFWTADTTSPSEKIEISDNFLDQGAGSWSQSIFIRNEVVDTHKAGDEMFYRDFRITGNVIRNAHLHGITVGEIDGLVVSHNTLLQTISSKTGGNVSVPMINVAAKARRVEVSGNIFPRMSVTLMHPNSDWKIEGNAVAQRDLPGRPNYYAQVFVDALSAGPKSLADLQIMPSSDLANSGAGSKLTVFNERPKQDQFYFLTRRESVSGDAQKFTVQEVYGPKGRIAADGAKVSWDFGDGQTGAGLSVSHSYAELGDYKVVAKLTLADGRTLSATRTVHVGVY